MPKPSPYPDHPVRVLRNLLGFPSAEKFATFVGVPAETIRNAEQGRQPVSERLAKLIGVATGVVPEWLMGGNEAKGPPRDIFKKLITKDEFEKYSGLKTRIKCDPNSEEWSDDIEGCCFFVAQLLRVAARAGRLPQCWYLLRMAQEEAAETLGLKQAWEEERTHELNARFDSRVTFGRDSEYDFGDYYRASFLLSATAQFRWDAAMNGSDSDREELLWEIENLRDVVEASFDILPRRARRTTAPTPSPKPSRPAPAQPTKNAPPRRA